LNFGDQVEDEHAIKHLRSSEVCDSLSLETPDSQAKILYRNLARAGASRGPLLYFKVSVSVLLRLDPKRAPCFPGTTRVAARPVKPSECPRAITFA
jgi:hypothetical protein